MKVAIPSIFSRVQEHSPASVAILCLGNKARAEWEEQKRVIRYELDSSVSLLRSLLEKRGIRVVTFTSIEIEETWPEIISSGMFIITGDPYYQLFRWGRMLIDRGYSGPLYIQINKNDAGKVSNARSAVTQALKYDVVKLLGGLAYLTQTRSEPREIDFEIPDMETTVGSEAVKLNEIFVEGRIRNAISTIYERSATARKLCIEIHGLKCVVCGFDFEKTYGPMGRGLIHVHHLSPLKGSAGIRNVNPRDDLKPVCPNCHLLIHSRSPMYSLGEVEMALKLVLKRSEI